MPASRNTRCASATDATPSQQAIRRGSAWLASGTRARAISALGTMAVGAWMNSTAAAAGSSFKACSACT